MTIGFGIIGAGLMGNVHAAAIDAVADAELIAVADIDAERAGQLAEQHPGSDVLTDYRALLARPEVQAVVIATPDGLHCEPAVDAAGAGKHVLLEKPIATTMEDADRIIAAAEAAQIKLAIGYCSRYDTTHAEIKRQIDTGSLGTVMSVYSRRHAIITEARRLAGRVSVEQYLAVHDLDLMLWYLDDDVVRVTSEIVTGPVYEELGVHDICWIMIKTRRGGVGVVECGWVLSAALGCAGDLRLEVIGAKGSAYADVLPSCLSLCTEEGWQFPDVLHWTKLHGELVGWYREQIRCFVGAIERDEPPRVTGRDGRRSLEIVLAARHSYEKHVPVSLPLT